jgi:hypothetical protein
LNLCVPAQVVLFGANVGGPETDDERCRTAYPDTSKDFDILAKATAHHTEKRNDGGLVGGDRIEVAHGNTDLSKSLEICREAGGRQVEKPRIARALLFPQSVSHVRCQKT